MVAEESREQTREFVMELIASARNGRVDEQPGAAGARRRGSRGCRGKKPREGAPRRDEARKS
jgi:hypothetical protein